MLISFGILNHQTSAKIVTILQINNFNEKHTPSADAPASRSLAARQIVSDVWSRERMGAPYPRFMARRKYFLAFQRNNVRKFYILLHPESKGKMPEWSIGPHSKCGERATVPRVRIPVFPRDNPDGKADEFHKSLDLWNFFYVLSWAGALLRDAGGAWHRRRFVKMPSSRPYALAFAPFFLLLFVARAFSTDRWRSMMAFTWSMKVA